MNMHKRIAFILGVTLVSSIGSHNIKAYASEFKSASAKVLTKEEKLVGSGRYETAIKVSEEGWPNGATNAVLVNDVSIVDALSATPFADAKNAPILLTQKDSLNEKTRAQLKSLGVKNVYIVGGQGVVSKKVEQQLKEDGINVDRIQGSNREATALEVAKRLNEIKPITEVAIVNGYTGLADAVSIAAVAANKDMPIILSQVDGPSAEVDKFIKSKNIKNSYIIGGEGVISKSLESKLPNAIRISGKNRKDTNAKVIDTFYERNELENIYVTKDGAKSENQLIDALSVGALAAKTNSPVMLVSNGLDNVQKEVINTKIFDNATQVGGNGNEVAFSELIEIQSEEIYNVSNIDDLNKAIANSNANDIINVNLDKMAKSTEEIIIKTDKKISLNLKGNYNNVIKIASENLKITNEGQIQTISIEGGSKYNSIKLLNKGTIESLTIKNGAKINLENNTNSIVTNLKIDKDVSKVNINNSGKIEKLTDDSSKTTITGSGTVNNPEIPNTEAPNNSGVSKPEESTPEESKPEITNPEESTPEVSNPEISNPEESSPEESNPENNEGVSSEGIDKVNNVINLINEINSSIVLENDKSIDVIDANLKSIEKEYNQLSLEERKLVINYKNLQTAQEQVEIARKKLHVVYNAISEIPEIKDNMSEEELNKAEEAVFIAEQAFMDLGGDLRKGVNGTEYSIIEDSRRKVDELRASRSKEKVVNVVNLIDEVNNSIVIEDKKSIETIEANLKNVELQYSLLSEDERDLVTNYEKLEDTKEQFNIIKEKLDKVYNAIAKIPELDKITSETLDKAEEAVFIAEQAFRDLGGDLKNAVSASEYSIIETSRRKIDELRASKTTDGMVSVVNLVDKINKIDGSIVLENDKSIDIIDANLKSIEKEYNQLSLEERKLVINYNNLKTAQEQVEIAREKLHAVYNAIAKIPEITEDMADDKLNEAEEAVFIAEQAFMDLGGDLRKGVNGTEYSIIEVSRYQINELRAKRAAEKN